MRSAALHFFRDNPPHTPLPSPILEANNRRLDVLVRGPHLRALRLLKVQPRGKQAFGRCSPFALSTSRYRAVQEEQNASFSDTPSSTPQAKRNVGKPARGDTCSRSVNGDTFGDIVAERPNALFTGCPTSTLRLRPLFHNKSKNLPLCELLRAPSKHTDVILGRSFTSPNCVQKNFLF